MAKCEVRRECPLPPPIKEVVLTLTPAEAKTLEMITWRIGGDSHESRRKHVASIAKALNNAGIETVAAERDRSLTINASFAFKTEADING